MRTQAARIRFKNKRVEKREPFDEEFAANVRDTLAAATWAQDRHPAAKELTPFLRHAVRGSAGRIHAVLWFEGLDEADILALGDEVRRRLRWLNPQLEILNAEICRRHPRRQRPGIAVSNLP
jgi:hypothetical protein